MRPMNSKPSWLTTGLTLMGMLLGAGSASALPASYDPFFGFLDTNLGGLPGFTIDESVPFLDAGEGGPPFPVELSGSTDVCILFGDSTCRASTLGVTGPYSVLVTVSIFSVDTDQVDGPFTLVLSGLAGDTYDESEVTVELEPVVPMNLNTDAVPDFSFGGSFEPFVRVVDETFDPSDPFFYIGWLMQLDPGGPYPNSVTFQYDVSTSPGMRGTPQLMANAIPLIPEPGTALLMALGLAGLASVGRRDPQEVA